MTSEIIPNPPTPAESNSVVLESLQIDGDFADNRVRDEHDRIDQNAPPASGTEPLSDTIIGLREWGTRRVFPLRAPHHSRTLATADTVALQLTRGNLIAVVDRLEIVHEGQSWRVKDRSGLANLKQDGRPTREVSLMPGTEVTIAGRTFIAESPRSIALRNFCSRLLGWTDDRIAAVDHALRAIRLASAGRAPLVLTGSGDLVPVAHAIHRHSLGDKAPFIVSDPRRKNTSATVRGPANCASSVEALGKAYGGTLCVRAHRLPHDFGEVLNAFREPENCTQLTICSRRAHLPNSAQIDIPSLDSRYSDLPRIVSEYIEDATHAVHAVDDCLGAQDIEWILDHAAIGAELTISGIEKAAVRAVALKISGDLTKAAKLLGMARVSLERWIKRRNYGFTRILDVHDEETQVQIQHSRPTLIVVYNHALIDLGHALARATDAIADNNVDRFRISANDAVSAWIATDAACRSLSQELGEVPSVNAARFELRQRCDDLHELLATAETRFASAALQATINYMRESLSIECGERLDNAPQTRS